MIADTLLNWDKAELASIIAERLADAEDLIEAFPSIEKPCGMEEDILPDFIEQNWKMILHDFDVQELEEWIADKEYEESWENWKNECVEQDHEYEEYKLEEYCWSIIDLVDQFRYNDLAERWGYQPKPVAS
ncbi:MAG: hypothetical protein IJL91_01625 [Bacteroidales bacterium]|nr:hypothetical protein [Bacteroidales bacterium]